MPESLVIADSTSRPGDTETTSREPISPDLPRMWVRPYYASFNGLRGVAVSMVFIDHFGVFWPGQRFTSWLWTGVDLFFVLSGFLITGILYDSVSDTHYFRNFYIRRALRIFPVFYGFFLLLILLTPLLHLHYERSLFTFVFYVGNLIVPFVDLAHHNPTVISVLHANRPFEVGNIGPLWSLCVEEQFYLIWPAVVWMVRDRRHLMWLCVLLSVMTLVGRCLLLAFGFNMPFLLHWSTYTRCDTLLIGAWCALWLRGQPLSLRQLRRYSSALFVVSACLLLGGLAVFHSAFFIPRFGYTLIALCGLAVIMQALDDSSFVSKIFQLDFLAVLGTVSYGFYFFHGIPEHPWVVLASLHPRIGPFVPVVDFAMTYLIAKLSFKYLEAPFLRLKSVLAPQGAGHNRSARLHVP